MTMFARVPWSYTPAESAWVVGVSLSLLLLPIAVAALLKASERK